jgi:hypothetical protein
MKNVIQEIKEVLTKNGYDSLDYELVVSSLLKKEITITPFKGFNSNLRNELITVIVTNGYSPCIKPNLA